MPLVAHRLRHGHEQRLHPRARRPVGVHLRRHGAGVLRGLLDDRVEVVGADVVLGAGHPRPPVGAGVGGHEGVVAGQQGGVGGVVGLVEVAVDVDEPAVAVQRRGDQLGDPALARSGLADQEHDRGHIVRGPAGQQVGDDAVGEDAPVLGVGEPVAPHLGRVGHPRRARISRESCAQRARTSASWS